MSDKIRAEHRERTAYVYVRQSSAHQVREHKESQTRQYALADRARQLGFERVEIIDQDQGRSGSGIRIGLASFSCWPPYAKGLPERC